MKRILFSIVCISLLFTACAEVGASDKNAQLIKAAENGDLQAVQTALAEGANINTKSNTGWTPLLSAAFSARTEVVKLLLEKGADVNAKENNGVTALMVAAFGGYTEIVNVLLEKGAEVNARTPDGATALMMAAMGAAEIRVGGHTEIVKSLLEKGADIKVRANSGVTALELAKKGGRTDIVQLLEKAGTKGPEAAVSDKNAQSMESGHSAVPGAAQVSTTWMPGAEASTGYIKVNKQEINGVVTGQGTGFLIASNLIVTNLHVVNGATSAEIIFPSGLSLPITGIVAEDAENDLAILMITPTGALPPPLPLTSVPAQVGDKLVMYGYPIVEESQKMSGGNVTCIGPSFGMPLAIITNAPLTHGFSGGPALNGQRQVVGVAQSVVIEGKVILKKQGILTPASCITSLSAGPSRALRDWTVARGTIASAAEEKRLGELDGEQEDWDKALQHFQKATQLDPNNYRAWYSMGVALGKLWRDDQAMNAFGKALALKPQFPEALCSMAQSFVEQQRYPEAIETLERCLRMNSNSGWARLLLGLTYVEAGQSEKAREQYQALKTIDPEAAEYLLGDIQTFSPLIRAAERGRTEVVKLLLEKGADVNVKQIGTGATALIMASQGGHTEVVKLLLEKGADVNAKDNNGITALLIASSKGRTEVVKLLLGKGADVNVKTTNDGTTAMWQASQNGHTEVVKLLLEKGADVNAKDNNGITALLIVSSKGQTEVVKLLLGKGAEVNAKTTNDGVTALWQAAWQGHIEVIKLLLEKGADVNVKKTTNGATALMAAAESGHTEVVKLLLEKGADVNAKDTTDGTTVLWRAARDGRVDVVKLLLEKGADMNVKRTTDGVTPLMMAAQKGHTEIVKLLMRKGADVNIRANNGVTALGAARREGHTDIVQLLEKAGAKE